jgi:formylglycine-generating enzyme required for sulfatase activity
VRLAWIAMLVFGPSVYRPLYPPTPEEREIPVAPFRIDARPVTNSQFATFVARDPRWARDRVGRIFADEGYLSVTGAPSAPVARVSWFAAKAYCQARGARLPTEAEWEVAFGEGADPTWHEWVLDFGATLVAVDSRDRDQDAQRFCGVGSLQAIDPTDYATFMRVAYRSSLQAHYTTSNLGFRCAEDLR